MSDVLLHLVGRKRPYGSEDEGAVIPYLIRKIDTPCWIDGAGNLHVDLRGTLGPGQVRTLFVGHVDTVHRRGGPNEFRRDAKGNLFAVGDCLGADDAAGVAILVEMIANRVPGYYLFTRGEEWGGVGSTWVANEMPDLLEDFDRAIAFDRRGTTDVITHQRGGRSCSDLFAEALADALNDQGLLYMPARGVYTDTAEFVDRIVECTNISVGYYNEHSEDEWLDMAHWRALCAAALAIDWEALPTCRQRAAWLLDGGDEPDETRATALDAADYLSWWQNQNLTDDGRPPFDPFVDDAPLDY